jgi:large subunit ribosomal protein L4
MFKIEVKNRENKQVKEIELPKEVFGYPVNKHLIWEVVKAFLANRRSGTAATKSRGMLRGGGRKPWRQKGRGTARAGTITSPLWRHGGTVFGPQPRDFSVRIPKKVKRNALKSALSGKLRDKEIILIDDLNIDEPKTKIARKIIDTFSLDSALIVDSRENRNFYLASRNLPNIKFVDYREVNVYDVVKYKNLVFSENGLESMMEVFK